MGNSSKNKKRSSEKKNTKSSGKGIAVIALILGASGLGFGGFSFFHFNNLITAPTTGDTTAGTTVQNSWYAEYYTAQTPSLFNIYTTLQDMHLLITVNAGESVYISFTAKYTIDASGAYEFIESYIYQDGVQKTAPYAYVGESITSGSDALRMVSIQCYITGLTAGAYNFSIRATTGDNSGSNRIDDTTLFIQTYL